MNYNTYKTIPTEQYLEDIKQERDRRVYLRTKQLQEALQGYIQTYTRQTTEVSYRMVHTVPYAENVARGGFL